MRCCERCLMETIRCWWCIDLWLRALLHVAYWLCGSLWCHWRLLGYRSIRRRLESWHRHWLWRHARGHRLNLTTINSMYIGLVTALLKDNEYHCRRYAKDGNNQTNHDGNDWELVDIFTICNMLV